MLYLKKNIVYLFVLFSLNLNAFLVDFILRKIYKSNYKVLAW